jgi:hypothetical protein
MHTSKHERSRSEVISEVNRRAGEWASLKNLDHLLIKKAGRFLIIPMSVAFLNLMLIFLFKS